MPEQWHEKFARYRQARGWSLREAAEELIAASDRYSPDQLETARQTVIRWEQGKVTEPRPDAREAIARMFDLPVDAFFETRPLAVEPKLMPPAPEEWTDLLTSLSDGHATRGALERTAIEVDRVCSDYASRPAPAVLSDVHELGRALYQLRPSVDLTGHLEIFRQLGWLSMLRACLLYDLKDEHGAHIARKEGIQVAGQLNDSRLSAWGDEIASWIALTKGDLAQAIRAAQVGIDKAGDADVAAQLYAQQAKAYARLQDRHKTEVSLDNVRRILDNVELPENMRNHFAIDPTKANFYAMDAYRVVRHDDFANAMAETVIATSVTPDGEIISPMRYAEALLTHAVVAARAGEVGVATSLTEKALSIERQSAPSLLMVAREVAREVTAFDDAEGRDLSVALKELMPS